MTISRSLRFWFVGLAIALAVYGLVGFLAVPAVMHRQITQRGSEALHRAVTLEQVSFNPFTFVTELETLQVAAREGDGMLLSVEHAHLNFDAFESLIRWQWQFGDVKLVAPAARLAVDEKGVLNVADLFGGDDAEAGTETGGMPRIGVDRLVVEGGSLDLADRSGEVPFASEVRPIAFALESFSTATGSAGTYQLSGSTRAGETFTWSGTLGAGPFASQGRIEITSIDAVSYQPFFARVLAGEIRSGRADLEAGYDIALGGERRALLREVKLRMTDVALALPGAEQTALQLPSLQLEMPEADLFARSAHVTQVALDGLAITAVRENDGTVNLSRFVAVEQSRPNDGDPAAQSQAAGGTQAFDVRIDRVALQNGRIELTDRTAANPAELQADQIVVTLTGVGSDPAAEVEVEGALRWQEGPGMLNVTGTFIREPLKASLQMTGSQLELASAAPYLRQFAAVQLVSGRAEVDGRLELSRAEAEALALRWSGRMSIEEVVMRDRVFDEELLRWSRLSGEGIDFSLNPRRLAVQQIRLEAPAFHVLLGPEGRTNLTAAFAGPGTNPDRPADAPAAGEPAPSPSAIEDKAATAAMPITLENVEIAGGTLTLSDRSGEEPMEVQITAVEGTLRGLSTERNEAGQLQLTASVLGSSPATLQGEVNVIGTDVFSGTTLALDVPGVRLEPLEPYVMRFLGHRMQQGRMQGDFAYRLSGGTLEGDNHVILDDFYLGDPVESPDALAVPVKLALALLRNRDGQVVLDVPVSGSLTSPEFSFADAIRGALGNILGKVATAPLAMLGAMFGAPGADLSQAEFTPGSAKFTDETQRKLEVLTRALQERPGLKLLIEWQPTPEADRASARQQRFAELLEQQRGRIAESIGDREITESQALRALYAERVLGESFPAGGPGLSTEAGPQSVAEQEAWYARFWHWFWGPWPEGDEGSLAETQRSPVTPEISEEQMRQELLASLELEQGAMEELARSRAEAAREQLVSAGISANRIDVVRQDDAPADPAKAPLIHFELAQAGTALAE